MNHRTLKAAVIANTETRAQRCDRIIAAFNAVQFGDAQDPPRRVVTGNAISKAVEADLRDMLKDKRSEYTPGMGRNVTLALEVSYIVRNIATDDARDYLHRVLAFI